MVLSFEFWQGYCEGDVPLNLGTLMTSVDTDREEWVVMPMMPFHYSQALLLAWWLLAEPEQELLFHCLSLHPTCWAQDQPIPLAKWFLTHPLWSCPRVFRHFITVTSLPLPSNRRNAMLAMLATAPRSLKQKRWYINMKKGNKNIIGCVDAICTLLSSPPLTRDQFLVFPSPPYELVVPSVLVVAIIVRWVGTWRIAEGVGGWLVG